ncbi:hypothetical protein VOLCADRAFT_104636 [Volvox carteri f. nagariensis]|uniref:Uncharacterized protein n=1 Tax=Volvox carteri f. nagariensis TaxID=3068 RepID=D8TVH2_VOLCA|nr:uncharacterized protein VOLCADRAFT_104636 [Volvox carteri f. nagariensis]EFJ48458.1 hypothetical protein VOLCADRAFT_104636 [Volvox carteri f. nagariensis]|eukprot:XP_002950257.1 hypothetical protein VOLCADRAFT_104636 [Volvox carteri f. nagariensis]
MQRIRLYDQHGNNIGEVDGLLVYSVTGSDDKICVAVEAKSNMTPQEFSKVHANIRYLKSAIATGMDARGAYKYKKLCHSLVTLKDAQLFVAVGAPVVPAEIASSAADLGYLVVEGIRDGHYKALGPSQEQWASEMEATVIQLTGKFQHRTRVPRALRSGFARATAVHHGFLGHGLVHGASDRRAYQHSETERNAPMSIQHQLPQSQYSSSSDPSIHSFGFNPPAHMPNEWMSDSHTRPANSSLAAHGCYRVVGPARISKRGDTLVAHLFRGSRVELLDRHGNPTSYGSLESLSEDADVAATSSGESFSGGSALGSQADKEACVAECVLVGAHVELCGSACSVDLVDLSVQPAVHHRNGHTYLSVRHLPPEAVIELDADSDLRHPINITPVLIEVQQQHHHYRMTTNPL